jgi:hypothetical protein
VRLQAFFWHLRHTFATPLSPFKVEYVDKNSDSPGSDDQTEEMNFKGLTVGELVAAGSDMADITARISDLTHEIHLIFRHENICSCKYKNLDIAFLHTFLFILTKRRSSWR